MTIFSIPLKYFSFLWLSHQFCLFGEIITSMLSESVMHKLFFIMARVSIEAVAVRAITGVSGPASDRNSPSFP